MRLSEEKKEKGTRAVNLETKDIVNLLKSENSLAVKKIKEIPKKTMEELKPFFSQNFFKAEIV